jgi:hypothetical protein
MQLSYHVAATDVRQIAACAPLGTLENVNQLMPVGEYIVPTKNGYAVEIINASPSVSASSIGAGSQFKTTCHTYEGQFIDPFLFTDTLIASFCWNGSIAWATKGLSSCAVWVPGIPGTSCTTSYTHETGRNTYWDYVDGVFYQNDYYVSQHNEDCYFHQKGSGAYPYFDCYNI